MMPFMAAMPNRATEADRRAEMLNGMSASEAGRIMPPSERHRDGAASDQRIGERAEADLGASRRIQAGVFTKRPGTLTNDFFVNLLDMATEWKPAPTACSRAATARPTR